jgi:predicted metal-dependent hydrolase
MLQQPLNFEPIRPVLNPQSLIPAVVFVRHPRARRYVIRVTQDGTVRVTVPRWGSKRAGAAFVAEQHAWIEKQRVRLGRERERQTSNDEAGQTNDERRANERAMIKRANAELPPRLLELASRHGLAVTKISIRNQRWRWGSCSRSGHICLNWRLVAMPEDVRDYVLIHELMHLKRMDHSPKFWKLVAEAFPPYKEARAWLRSHGAR